MIQNWDALIKENLILYNYIQLLHIRQARMDKQEDVDQERVEETQKVKVPQEGGGLVFRDYPSLQPTVREKTINTIRKQGLDKPDIQWVASEKIHGSNFSIHCTGSKIRYGRRNDFLCNDIDIVCEDPGQHFNQNFFGAAKLVSKYHNNIINIYKNLQKAFPEIENCVIYGEYFGGLYPGHIDEDNQETFSIVQKQVCYIPHHEFMVFDIRITTKKGGQFWVDVEDIPKYLGDNLKFVPIYARGTFDQMMAINSKIDSTIPQLLGFPKLKDNIIEGFVIRPNKNIPMKGNERVILKRKNQQFQQKKHPNFINEIKEKNKNKEVRKKIKEVELDPLDPEIAPYIEALELYLNHNRYESVRSKYPDEKDVFKFKNYVMKDIMADAAEDEFKYPEQADLKRKVKCQFDKRVLKMVNRQFKKK